MQVDCGAERVLALERVPQMVRLQLVFVRLEGKRLHGSVASKDHARSLAIAPATDKVRPVSTGFDDDGKQMPTMSLTRPTAKCSRSAAASLPLAVRRPRTSGSASAGRAGQLLCLLSVHGGRQLPGKAGPACAERADVRQGRRSTGEL